MTALAATLATVYIAIGAAVATWMIRHARPHLDTAQERRLLYWLAATCVLCWPTALLIALAYQTDTGREWIKHFLDGDDQ